MSRDYCQRGNPYCQQIGCDCHKARTDKRRVVIPQFDTVESVFDRCELCFHPGYEAFFYWPIGDTNDMYWLRWDANDAEEGVTGIQMLDGFDWVPIEKCAGITKEERELLHGQLPNAIPLNNLPADPIRDKLPGWVQDILSGRFATVSHARNDDD